MTIGTPVSLGETDSNSTPANLAITTGANVVAGDVIAVFHFNGAINNAITSITDTGGNTYQQVMNKQTVAGREIWLCYNATAFSSGGSITCNFPGGTKHAVTAIRIPGILNAAPWDPHTGQTSQTSSNTNAAPSINTNNYYAVNECILAAMMDGSNPGTVTHGGSFTALNTGGTNAWIKTAYQIVSASAYTANIAYAPTWATSQTNSVTVTLGLVGACSC